MRRLILLLLVLIPFTPARADALTLRDIIELSRAGLGDDVLLALIEVDRPVFNIDTPTLKSLKAAGVSERVIVAIVRSGRTPPPAVEAAPVDQPDPAPEPQVIVIDHHDASEVREVVVPYAVPVFVPLARRRADFDRRDDLRSTVLVNDRVNDRMDGRGPMQHRPEPPVYWGGTLRPDAWQPSPPERRAPPVPPIKK